MSVNGVTSKVESYQTYAEQTKVEQPAKEAAATEVKEKFSWKDGATYASKMTEEQRAELVAQLQRDNQAQIDSFKGMVTDMLTKQGFAAQNADDIWSMLASGNFTVDELAAKKAQEAISEDGYWGVNQTSDRIMQMAVALSGGDEEGMNEMLDAFEKGYKQATKSWGKELPDISKQTYEAVQEKFREYQQSMKNDPAQNPTI